MDKYIIIVINLFARNSDIFVSNDTESPSFVGSYTLEELPKIVVDLAHAENVYKVKIAGANKFSQLIEFGIEQNEMTKYSENKIKVEVI